jgi:lipid A 4'-phosphatase
VTNRWSSNRVIAAVLASLGAASLIFYAVPAIDLYLSGLFYNGQTFPIASIRPVEWLRILLYMAEDAGFLLTLAAALYAARRGTILNLRCRDWLYQASIFVLGPGLIVNRILKSFWGRARPYQITTFGGDKHFSPAWVISDQCASNCSFSSGEMAGATALAVCLSLVLRANRDRMDPTTHRLAQIMTLALPLLTAVQRITVGRHFLSDVVISTLIVLLIAALLRPAFYRSPAV